MTGNVTPQWNVTSCPPLIGWLVWEECMWVCTWGTAGRESVWGANVGRISNITHITKQFFSCVVWCWNCHSGAPPGSEQWRGFCLLFINLFIFKLWMLLNAPKVLFQATNQSEGKCNVGTRQTCFLAWSAFCGSDSWVITQLDQPTVETQKDKGF